MSRLSDPASERLRSDALAGKSRPYVMAHRGNRVACPENTLAASRQAVADGADIIEMDLHLTIVFPIDDVCVLGCTGRRKKGAGLERN